MAGPPREHQHAHRGSQPPREGQSRAGFALLTVWPSIHEVWPRPRGFLLQRKKINQAASPRIALPPLSFYFATSLAPKMSLWAHSRLPSPPVSGCLAPVTPITVEKGDRSSAWFLEMDPWAAWQGKCLASMGADGGCRMGTGTGGTGWLRTAERQKAPCHAWGIGELGGLS